MPLLLCELKSLVRKHDRNVKKQWVESTFNISSELWEEVVKKEEDAYTAMANSENWKD